MYSKYIIILLLTTSIFAQSKIETKVTVKQTKIGGQINMTFKTVVDTASIVVFPKNKTFGPLEVIRSYPTDTIKKDAQYELIKKYGLTQFDSGRYVIPKMTVLIDRKPYLTDTVSVHISDVAVDTLKQKMFDIKPILSDEEPLGNWWKWLLALLVIAGITALIYYLIKKNQAKKIENLGYASPIEKAIGELQLLEKKGLLIKGEVKTYYSELTDIAREYIEEVIEIPAKESTTSELIALLKASVKTKKLALTNEAVSNLEKVLKQADLVKFAKVLPSEFEIIDDQKRIENSILSVHKSIPTEIIDEEAIFDSLKQKELLIKKQKRKRIILTIVIVLLLLFATLIYFIATRGLDYVKDNVFGHPTKELLDDQWVYSQYGTPSVGLSTPKALKRIVIPNQPPVQNVKNTQRFLYGSVLDNFFINLITTSFQNEVKITLEQIINLEIKGLENQYGAKNITLNQEEYQSKDGVNGRIGKGTFQIINPLGKEPITLQYEVLVFNEQNGVQEIIITHNPTDAYARQIAERVLNTVEIKAAKQ